jgi:tetratricopeptide (TPR) repeat protein
MKKQGKKIEKQTEVSSTRGININIIVVCILFFLTICLYINTLGHGFVLDDPLAIGLNKNVTAGLDGIGNIIKGSYRENNFGGQLYRPLPLILFAIEWTLSPNNAFVHHLFNILWYGASVVLIFLLIHQWFGKKSLLLPLSIALIFMAHPIHTEVVANIKSRDEIMALFFSLFACYTLGKYMLTAHFKWLLLSVATYFLALLSKESAITMFPVFGLICWFIYGTNSIKSIKNGCFYLIPVVLFFLIRYSIFGSTPTAPVDIMDNPIVSAQNINQRVGTSFILLWKYMQVLLFPHPLSCDYSYRVIPVVSFSDPLAVLSLIAHVLLGVWALISIKSRKFLSLCALAYLMSISLFSQLPIIIGTMFGERLAYMPSFWFIAGIVYFIYDFVKIPDDSKSSSITSIYKTKPVFSIGLIVIVSLFAFKTLSRNSVWKDNYTLFTTDAETYPNNVRLNNGAANECLTKTDNPKLSADQTNQLLNMAEAYCDKILKIRPVPTVYLTLGNIRLKQKKYQEALDYYDQVNDLPNIVDRNKALALREMGRDAGEKEQNIAKSQELLLKSLALYDKDAESWFLLGVSNGVSGNHQKAAEFFEKAFHLNPSPAYAKNVVMAYQNIGNQAKIAEYQQYVK